MKKNSFFRFFFEKNAKRLLFMRNVCERVNEACKFEKIEIKKR